MPEPQQAHRGVPQPGPVGGGLCARRVPRKKRARVDGKGVVAAHVRRPRARQQRIERRGGLAQQGAQQRRVRELDGLLEGRGDVIEAGGCDQGADVGV